MSCLGLRTDLSFILNKQTEDPYFSTYTTIVSTDIKYLDTYTIGVSTDIPHKYLDYSLVPRLFNYTTVVRIYDLPSQGVWIGFTGPGNYPLIWNSPQFHKAQRTFQKNDKNLRCQRGGKRLAMLSSIQDMHMYANMISLFLYLPELGLNKTVNCQSQIDEGFMEPYPWLLNFWKLLILGEWQPSLVVHKTFRSPGSSGYLDAHGQ